MLSSATFMFKVTLVWFETPKVAISAVPLGTRAGVQLAAVYQSSLVGLRFQVALMARARPGASPRASLSAATSPRVLSTPRARNSSPRHFHSRCPS